MRRFIIRYKVKPGRTEENEELIRKVFEELHQTSPVGVHYSVYKGLDGVSFAHVVSYDTAVVDNPIPKLAAFKAFQACIGERVETPPETIDLEPEPIGTY